MKRLAPADIERLASDPARQSSAGPIPPIDLSRPFVPEDQTQLYYTPIYRGLPRAARLRYNQLFGVRINEYIMVLESDLVEAVFEPLRFHRVVASDPALVRCIETMIEEERRHYRGFASLNRACFPELYAGSDRYFSGVPWPIRALFRTLRMVAGPSAFSLWYVMAMEECSTTMARNLALHPDTETLGPLEPAFSQVHREHLKDETRHLHIDDHLIDLCLIQASRTRRRLDAAFFKWMLGPITRPTRHGSGVKVIRELVRQMPELADRKDEMIDAVLALGRDRAFQTSLFNRQAMPHTFELFDRMEEFHDLGKAMVGYDRP
jgi:hypothetical protein